MATEQTKPAELELQEQDDGAVLVRDPDEVQPAAERTGRAVEDDEDDPAPAPAQEAHDAELTAAKSEEEREEIRARRRKERSDKRQRAKDREASLRAENLRQSEIIRELESRVGAVERRAVGSDLAQLDNALNAAAADVAFWEVKHTEAVNAGNGAAASEAIKRMTHAQRAQDHLGGTRRQLATAAQPAATPANRPDPRVLARAESWASSNAWYDPQGKDLDSKLAATIDSDLTREGFLPSSDEYWEELSARVEKYLPHRSPRGGAKSGIVPSTEARKPSRSVVTGGGREASSTAGAAFTLSKERVQALKDANMWDDPATRNDMIRRYRDMDRNSPSK